MGEKEKRRDVGGKLNDHYKTYQRRKEGKNGNNRKTSDLTTKMMGGKGEEFD